MKKFIPLFTVAFLAASAQAQMSSSVLPSSLTTQEFVKTVASSDMFEIETSRVVNERSESQDVQNFAAAMVRDHEKTSSELKGAVDKALIPSSMNPDHQKKLDELRAEKGAQMNEMYKKQQIQAHQDAISLFEAYAQRGDNPTLKQWAAAKLPTLREHYEHAQRLKY